VCFLICLINTAKIKPTNDTISRTVLSATTSAVVLNNQDTILPISPGIESAALIATVLRYEATSLRAALTLSTNPFPGEGVGVGGVGVSVTLVNLVTANTIVLIINPIAVVMEAMIMPSFLNNSLSLSPRGYSLLDQIDLILST